MMARPVSPTRLERPASDPPPIVHLFYVNDPAPPVLSATAALGQGRSTILLNHSRGTARALAAMTGVPNPLVAAPDSPDTVRQACEVDGPRPSLCLLAESAHHDESVWGSPPAALDIPRDMSSIAEAEPAIQGVSDESLSQVPTLIEGRSVSLGADDDSWMTDYAATVATFRKTAKLSDRPVVRSVSAEGLKAPEPAKAPPRWLTTRHAATQGTPFELGDRFLDDDKKESLRKKRQDLFRKTVAHHSEPAHATEASDRPDHALPPRLQRLSWRPGDPFAGGSRRRSRDRFRWHTMVLTAMGVAGAGYLGLILMMFAGWIPK
jgi:hypothetical protein